jgi:hypothetical protein
MDQRLLAAPHGFSQRATSFIASWCQGIHRTPFSCSLPRGQRSRERYPHLAQEPSNPCPAVRQSRPTAHRRTYPHPDAALPMTLREQPHPPDGRTHAHIHSLSRPCARQTAGTWRYHLIRSDIQFTRADAPNPDSRFKEHTQPHPQMPPEHNKARLDRKPKRSSSCISVPAATTVTSRTQWLLWRWTVSNRRPPACKAGALPLSYTPRRHKNENFLVLSFKKEQLLN